MSKLKLFEVKNLLTGLKAMVVSIISSVILAVGYALVVFLRDKAMAVSVILGLLLMVLSLFLWGFLAKKLWNWN